jgi:hypothetical protein
MEPQTTVHRKPPQKQSRHTWFSFLCGCVLALIFMELALRPLSGKYENSTGVELRYYREGFSWAHFTPDGLRVTGNPKIEGAPNVVILGDSHVEAFQVGDRNTTGAVLERRLRNDGKAWNVLQYGWSGADGPDYVYAAPLIKEKFPSKTIFLVMNAGDFSTTSNEVARLIERDGQVVAEGATPGSPRGRAPSYGGRLARKIKESALFYATAVRFNLDILPQLTEHRAQAQQSDSLAKAAPRSTLDMILRGLKQAYGDDLYILYTPEQPYSADTPPETQESELLAECNVLGMHCRSLRQRMIEDLLVNHKFARGFSDAAPDSGHFNAHGHELVADEIYDWLRSVQPPTK